MYERYRYVCLAAALLCLAALGTARADRLDNQLNSQMDDIVAALKRKYSTIGVLRFRVQEGTRKESFDSPLSGRIAERVETLVLLHNGSDERQAIKLVRDIGKVATAKKIGSWYTNTDARKRLLAQEYPMAWGKQTAVPDAFLTGKVSLSKDRKKTLIALEVFDRHNPGELRKVGALTLDTDHFILRDLGYSVNVSRRSRVQLTTRRSTPQQQEEIYLDEFGQQNPPQSDPTGTSQPTGATQVEPGNIGGIAMEILVNGKPAAIRTSGAQGQAVRWQTDAPPVNSTIAIRLRNTTDKRLGVVLRLNGVSTINEQRDDPENAAKWIIPARKSYLIKGFYLLEKDSDAQMSSGRTSKRTTTSKETIDEGNVGLPQQPKQPAQPTQNGTRIKLFRVLVEADMMTVSQELGDKLGLIEVDVFEEGVECEDQMIVSPKGLPPSKEKLARSSYLGLRAALLKSSKLTSTVVTKREGTAVVKKEAIVPDKEAIQADQKIQLTTFPNARLVSRLTLKIQPSELVPTSGGQ